LTDPERRLLRSKIRDLKSRERLGPRILLPGAGVIAVLWILTLAAADAPWFVVTLVWFVVGAGILLWVRHDLQQDLRQLAQVRRGYESAARRNQAEVFDIRAIGFVEFEEVEDEGACYAFALEGERLVFVMGQQFYPEAKFPSLDFSLVYPLDEDGHPVDEIVGKRGPRASAARVIPAAAKLNLAIPDHMEVVRGTMDGMEEALRAPGA
jgi:hypothetical protein